MLLLCGPSGIGKSTLASLLLDGGYGSHFGFSVSHTTRKPRSGEKDGVNYHFVERREMERMIQRGDLVEHVQLHGNLYGTSLRAMRRVHEEQNKICVMDVDTFGVKGIKALPQFEAKCVGLIPPSFEVMEERLRQRRTENEAQIQQRLMQAREDVEFCETSPLVDAIIVNHDTWKHGYPALVQVLKTWYPWISSQ